MEGLPMWILLATGSTIVRSWTTGVEPARYSIKVRGDRRAHSELSRREEELSSRRDHRDTWHPGRQVRHRQTHNRRPSPSLTKKRESYHEIGAVLGPVHLHRYHRCCTRSPAAHKDSARLDRVLGHTYRSNLFDLFLNFFYCNLKEPDLLPVELEFILLEPKGT